MPLLDIKRDIFAHAHKKVYNYTCPSEIANCSKHIYIQVFAAASLYPVAHAAVAHATVAHAAVAHAAVAHATGYKYAGYKYAGYKYKSEMLQRNAASAHIRHEICMQQLSPLHQNYQAAHAAGLCAVAGAPAFQKVLQSSWPLAGSFARPSDRLF
jgi:hypothetical protein